MARLGNRPVTASIGNGSLPPRAHRRALRLPRPPRAVLTVLSRCHGNAWIGTIPVVLPCRRRRCHRASGQRWRCRFPRPSTTVSCCLGCTWRVGARQRCARCRAVPCVVMTLAHVAMRRSGTAVCARQRLSLSVPPSVSCRRRHAGVRSTLDVYPLPTPPLPHQCYPSLFASFASLLPRHSSHQRQSSESGW